ncbi:hypothetical protein [Spirochaeta africana]|uniref:RNA polymerase sigma factor, sigma-70 family n=1 Tax=Spirochaeta africana (strain ATCC 700263 / DSM 8902 / Z-7692) TaxID=889378 RepID=H9UI75_SPIAZ|nr:hypothetical protein [Spirochaeta africana]AFG37218.1 hypothetical protein Spiaf_1134 [Spirochaeta africana DSM 8902]
MTELTRVVLRYQRGQCGLHEVFRQTAPLIYSYPVRSRRGTEDDSGEFLLYYYRRLVRLLHRYQYRTNISFDAYLHTSLRYQYATFTKRRAAAMECHENPDLDSALGGEHQLYHDPRLQPQSGVLQKPGMLLERMHTLCGSATMRLASLRRRMAILVLMNAGTILPEEIALCSTAAGIETAELTRMVDTLRQQMNQRSQRAAMLRRRRNRAFVELFVLQQRLQRSCDPTEQKLLHSYCERSHTKLEATRRQLSQVRCQPMHREIAELLGIPVGSVHSSISAMRRLFRSPSTSPQVLDVPRPCVLRLPHDRPVSNQQHPQDTRDTTDRARDNLPDPGRSWHHVLS